MLLANAATAAHSPTHAFCLSHRRWPDKQFVGVSESYLEACGATVYFVKTPQTHVPSKFTTHSSEFHYQESILDVPEADMIEDI